MATGPDSPYEPFSATPPKKKMSGGMKVFLGVLIGGGVLALLCCGGLGIASFFFIRTAEKSFSDDPQRVHEVAQSIADVKVPEPLKPKGSMDLEIPLAGRIRMAMYGSEDENDAFMLFELSGQMASDPDQAIAQANRQMKRNNEFETESSEQVELTVRGKPAKFTFAQGFPSPKARQDKTTYLQVTGAFEGKNGPAFLVFSGPDSRWTVQDVKGLIESIK